MPALVSVIIPCYGQAPFLPEAIESVLGQDYRCHEIIVIDDGSPDPVGQVVQRYPVSCCRVPERHGVGAARNLGIAQSRGEYIVCLDADDRLLPNALASGVATLTNRPDCALVWGTRRLIDAGGNPLPSEPRTITGTIGYADLLRENLIGPPVGVMFRRQMTEAAGGFATDISGGEDYELYLRLAREHDCYGHGTLIAEYRVHPGNMSADLGFMLKAILGVLDRQKPWVERSFALRRAAAAGRRWARASYDLDRRLILLSEHARARRWSSAMLASADLLFKYPRRFLPILLRRLRRALTRGR